MDDCNEEQQQQGQQQQQQQEEQQQQQDEQQQEEQQHDDDNQHHHHRHHHRDNGQAPRRRTVLIAMDGSVHSFFAFDWYMYHLHQVQNDVIVAHSSNHSPDHLLVRSESLMSSVMATDNTIMTRLIEKEEEEVNKIVEKIKGKLTNTGVRGKLIRLTGDAGPAIVESAKHHQADLIVTGSRGMGTLRRTLIGSVSDYILHHAKCPVLICRNKS